MTESRRRAAASPIALLTGLLVVASGCLHLPAESTAPRRWLLSPTSQPVPVTSFSRTLGLGPIEIPGYLDRAEVVERLSEHELRADAFDLWAEPLGEGIQRVLAQELTRRVPGLAVVEFPWKGPADIDYRLTMVIDRFEHDVPRRLVVLEVGWALGANDASERTAGRIQVVEQPVEGDGFEAIVAAMSASLVVVAEEIGEALEAEPGEVEEPR